MNKRGKLIELIDNFIETVDVKHWYSEELDEKLADYLLKNNVEPITRCEKCKFGSVSCISKSKDGEEDMACICALKDKVVDIDYFCGSGIPRARREDK